jgi:glycosyltransferase involved in cell wall biosynthesis
VSGSLTILFTNIWLERHAGSEVVLRDLAVGALRRGHRPIVYTPAIGPFAQHLTRRGIAVVDDLRLIAEPPDIIHAHHVIPCGEAIIRFPGVPVIDVCHSFEHWVEAPAYFPQIRAYVAVDDACRDRLVHAHGIDPARIVTIYNAVDLTRIPPRPRPLPQRPRRAAVFSKAAAVAPAIRAACAAHAIELETIGPQAGREVEDPERHLVEFDLVFASARAALEGLCCGCAVIACDGRGLAGMVTAENFAALRTKNFGLRSLVRPVTPQALIDEIGRYDREDARAVGERARREADLEDVLDAFAKLYAEAIEAARAAPVSPAAHEEAVARFLRDYLPRLGDPRWSSLAEREAFAARIRALESELAMLNRSRLLKLGRWLRRLRGIGPPW